MTKNQLIEALAKAEGITLKGAEMAVNLTLESIAATLEKRGKVEIRGLGAFKVKHYEGYIARNPKTGEPFEAKAKKLPVFKAGKELKERVDGSSGNSDSHSR